MGGGGGGNPHSSGLDSSRKVAGQNPQWERSPVFRLLGPSRFVPDKMFSLFFACLQPSRGGVCVTHLCCPGSYVLSAGRISQSVLSGARPSLARSLGNLAKPPTHSPTSPSRSLRSDSPPGLFASMGGRSALSTGFSQHLGGNEAVKGNQAESRSRRRSTSL